MKKICSLVIILSVFHFAGLAQYNQGKIYIDGNVNYNNDNSNVPTNQIGIPIDTKSTNIIISPNIGYFIANNFAIGVGIEYKSLSNSTYGANFLFNNQDGSKVIVSEVISSKWNELAPTIFAKYIIPVSDKLSFSLKAKFSHGLVTDEISDSPTTVTTTVAGQVTITNPTVLSEKPSKQTNRFNISPEFQYLITDKIGLQINFTGFSYNSVPVINPRYESNDGVTFNPVIDYGTQKTTSFNINPSSWSFGVFILLGGKNSEAKELK